MRTEAQHRHTSSHAEVEGRRRVEPRAAKEQRGLEGDALFLKASSLVMRLGRDALYLAVAFDATIVSARQALRAMSESVSKATRKTRDFWGTNFPWVLDTGHLELIYYPLVPLFHACT